MVRNFVQVTKILRKEVLKNLKKKFRENSEKLLKSYFLEKIGIF